MAQHDYNIANQTGANFRTDLNNALLAISSNNSGSSEPSTMYAYEWWIDTSANVLKLRNSSNNAWITMPFSITADNTVDINAGTVNGISSFSFGSGATVTSILDEDDFSSDSATALATQQSIKAYIASQITLEDLDISDGSSTISIDLDSETLSLLGGTGVTSTASGNGVTFAIGQSVGTSDNVVFNQVTGALVGNASTATALATARTISGVSFDGTANITLDTDDIGEGTTNKYFTAERVDDQVNTLLTAGANISLTYDDTAGTLTIANTNSADITSVVAGSGLTGGGTSGDVTLAVGVDDSSIEINSDALRVKATGITNAMLAGSIANAKLANSSITVNSQAIALGGSHTFDTDDIGEGSSNLYFTNERTDDRVATLIQNGTGISFTYNDSAGTLTPVITLSPFDTDNLSEGSSNLYYTDTRVNSAIDTRVTNTFINNLSGVVADTATALATGRTIGLSGDVTATGVSFDGTGNITLSTTIAANSIALGTDTVGNYVATIAGSTNEIEVSGSGSETATVTIGLPDDVTIAGNLTVNGTTTTVNSDTLSVTDPLIKLAKANSGADSLDIGFYGLYDTSGSQDLYAGLFRDANDSGKFKLFKDLQVEPTTTVNTSGTGYTVGTLVSNLEGNVTGQVSTLSNHDTDNLSEGSSNLYFTNARSRSAISASGDISYNSSTGVISFTQATAPVTSVNSATGAVTLDTDDIAEGSSNLYMTTERVQDIVGGMVTGNTETGITVTYDDSDGTLDFVVGTLNQDTTGNAATATALETARAIALSGDVVGTANFDGTAGISISTTIQANSVVLGTDTVGDYVSTITAGTGLTSTGATSGEGQAHTLSVDAAQTQITSVGSLDGGSITSGFGSIDVGSSAITTTGTVTGGTLAGTLSTAAQTNITSVGTLTTLTVDDITINGSTISDSGDFTIDVAGGINLDSDGGEISFKDAGTEIGKFNNSSSDFAMEAGVQDKDILFKGNDGGTGITALTLDMSEAGEAIFNDGVDAKNFKINGSQGSDGQVLTSTGSGVAWEDASGGVAGIVSNADATAITIDSSERVGIATTSPNANLHIGSSNAIGDVTNPAIQIGGTSTYRGGLYTTSEGFILDNNNGDDGISFFTKTNGEMMRLQADGVAHITSAGSPIAPTIKHSGATGDVAKLRLINRSGQSSNKGGALELGAVTDDGVSRSDVLGSIAGLKTNATSANREGYLQLSTSSGSALSERLRVDSNGNIAIGGTSASNFSGYVTLDLRDTTGGIIDFSEATAGVHSRIQAVVNNSLNILNRQAYPLHLGTNDTTRVTIDGNYGNISFGSQKQDPSVSQFFNAFTGNYGSGLSFQNNGFAVLGLHNNNFLNASTLYQRVLAQPTQLLQQDHLGNTIFLSAASGTAGATFTFDENMRIAHGGAIHIGTTSEANGSTGGASFSADSNDRRNLICATTATSNLELIEFRNPNGTVGDIKSNGSATSYNTSSDGRLKEVTGVARGLDVINKLNPVAFNWKVDNKASEGLIAQEVKDLVPDAVSQNTKTEYYQMDYSKLVVHLIAGMKEQQEQIDALQSEIKILKGE